jgi:hypothetical protein
VQTRIFSGCFGKCHCQGIAVDPAKGFIYYSFTTKLVKSDLDGNIIGSVDHIIGHLGCIDFNEQDGKLYASLEYKNDVIGKGILHALDAKDQLLEDGFYVAIFDVDRIDRRDMDAERDGVMRTVYLKPVVDDYNGTTVNRGRVCKHVHGCSGIDGLAIGPDFGNNRGAQQYLHVCYGVYSDPTRTDNDYQVILQYEIVDWWEKISQPLLQHRMHQNGPLAPRNKYFLYTGNTTYGVQNMEYDAYTGDYFLCVYPGKKQNFPNYPMFVINGDIAPRREELRGFDTPTEGLVLTLQETGLSQNGIHGMDFPHGSTGFYAFGDGRFYVSEEFRSPDTGEQATNVCLYRLQTSGAAWHFERCQENA